MVATATANRPEQAFKYVNGFSGRVDPDLVGARIEELERKEGVCVPERLLDEARHPDSPMHNAFTWDDGVAAERYRIGEARSLVRAVVRVAPRPEGQPVVRVVPRVNVKLANGTRGYMDAAKAMDDEALRCQVIAEAECMLRGVINRYRGIPGLLEHLEEALRRVRAV